MVRRKVVVVLLLISVFAPMILYTDRLSSTFSPTASNEYGEEASHLSFGNDIEKLHTFPLELANAVKEPVRVLYLDNSSASDQILAKQTDRLQSSTAESELPLANSGEHKTRMLWATAEESSSERDGVIEQVTDREESSSERDGVIEQLTDREVESDGSGNLKSVKWKMEMGSQQTSSVPSLMNEDSKRGEENNHIATKRDAQMDKKAQSARSGTSTAIPDAKVRHLRDQLIRAKVYQTLGSTRSNPHFIRELRLRIKEVQRVVGDATKDSDLPKNANEKLNAMEQTLAKGKQIQEDCSAIVKKLRAMLHSTEEQLRVHKKQALFLTQLTAKTLPKGLNCLPLRLSNEYFSLASNRNMILNQEKFDNPKLYHYALFSDNILATAVVVNSTASNAKNPEDHVFHIVTDRLNYAAMKMWFIANPPGKATVQVQNIEEFTWLNASYSPVLKQLGSKSTIDYYFRAHHANSDANLKYRNPKYLSILNHLRFYLPEIFPKLDKIVFLDDDIVVQKDLSGLWNIHMKGKVNGAVETCGTDFHRFHKYLNFSNPLIAKSLDPHACGWAYGMNVFDLAEWRKQKVTEVYHYWQNLNSDRQLWKLGTLPPGLITFYNRTFPLDQSWHVLGLGYKPNVNQKEIERAAVIHYNGNLKPWLEVSFPKYRSYWTKYVNYDQEFLRDCNINP